MTQPDRKEVLTEADMLNGKYKTISWGIDEKNLSKTFVFKDFTFKFIKGFGKNIV